MLLVSERARLVFGMASCILPCLFFISKCIQKTTGLEAVGSIKAQSSPKTVVELAALPVFHRMEAMILESLIYKHVPILKRMWYFFRCTFARH